MSAPAPLPRALLTIANVLIPVAVLTFAVGFFPYKPFIPGLAGYGPSAYGSPPDAPFDKVVFMVVDALRSDFVFSNTSGFKFTQSLISAGAALPFTAHATSPTITMPRVKAITTGSIPSFLDVILNFAESDTTSTLAYQDTWLAQLKAKDGGKLVMYGDDTWLKLFPETFERADGTSSFFVSDFTEVDNNVTRHVPDELRNSDWNAMIMHYLGLDHIGHKAGPLSPNMVPKQVEMDAIVKQIYEAMENQSHLKDTLLVLCGDHGMNEGGNHGGSAPGETSPALVFMSPKLKKISNGLPCPSSPSQDFDYYTKVEQSDIAPTLAGLLGFPVPLNNLGVFIPDFLPLWSKGSDRAQLLMRNAFQILQIANATFPRDELACKWLKVMDLFQGGKGQPPKDQDVVPLALEFCRAAQDVLSSTASNYNLTLLIVGAALATGSMALAIAVISPNFIPITAAGIFYALATILDAPELVRGASPAAMAFLEGLNLVKLARCVFIGVLVGVGWVVLRESAEGKGRSGPLIVDALHDFLALILVTQTRASNIPLFLIFRVQQHFLTQLNLQPTEHTLTSLLLSHTSFFALGNSNAISSIDLSNAYNGVAGYNIVAVGVLLFLSNWAGPIYWTSASILGLLDSARWSRGSAALRQIMREKERSKWQEVGAKGQSRKIAGASEPGVSPGLKDLTATKSEGL
ncbi:Type I phosphodiesterase/nucleotide pyrophosphatase/phosphate transferase [Neofusicoccum parvum]|uniref:Type I phosphodiesterase/nucleotide pyrophosphatase/phosphate transferase n=1 Tax=Neofusicoccum parvum TaxID=310453 RepID=A0ACB5SNW3_9PEZI|nr:Type I phosphodiesterase/nucleotide pyrophosphatase/phosphate transferase [Neofusicoccum parvum]